MSEFTLRRDMSLMRRLTNLLLCPNGRLQNLFPWDSRTASAKYGMSLVHFAIGTGAMPALLLVTILGLAQVPGIFLSFAYDSSACAVMLVTALCGAAATALTYTKVVRWRRQRFDGIALGAYSLLGAVAAVAALVMGLNALMPVFHDLMTWILNIMQNEDESLNMTFVMSMSALSFVLGFGMQMRFIHRTLKQEGLSLADAMSLHLRNLKGSWWLSTAWNVVWPVIVAYGLVQIVGESVTYVMGPAHQGTVDMAKEATGGNFIAFALMAALGAPIFEELVFRGFLFQIFRSSLRRTPSELKLAPAAASGRFLGLRSAWVWCDNVVRSRSHFIAVRTHRFLGARPDLAALVISSALFSLLHMQFHPTTLVLLFALGCIHAELYRRTGSLYCSMLLHAVNNGIEVIKLGLGG